jgi:hypothetical protein
MQPLEHPARRFNHLFRLSSHPLNLPLPAYCDRAPKAPTHIFLLSHQVGALLPVFIGTQLA